MHALLTLNDPRHASVCREVAALALRASHGKALDDDAQARMRRIQGMSEELEWRAEAAEVEIWRELLGNRQPSAISPKQAR